MKCPGGVITNRWLTWGVFWLDTLSRFVSALWFQIGGGPLISHIIYNIVDDKAPNRPSVKPEVLLQAEVQLLLLIPAREFLGTTTTVNTSECVSFGLVYSCSLYWCRWFPSGPGLLLWRFDWMLHISVTLCWGLLIKTVVSVSGLTSLKSWDHASVASWVLSWGHWQCGPPLNWVLFDRILQSFVQLEASPGRLGVSKTGQNDLTQASPDLQRWPFLSTLVTVGVVIGYTEPGKTVTFDTCDFTVSSLIKIWIYDTTGLATCRRYLLNLLERPQLFTKKSSLCGLNNTETLSVYHTH